LLRFNGRYKKFGVNDFKLNGLHLLIKNFINVFWYRQIILNLIKEEEL